jgi:hypothetical protein
MLAREERVPPCVVAGILFRINAGSNLVRYQNSSDVSAVACACLRWSCVKFWEACITVDCLVALCAGNAALPGVRRVLYYV